MRGRPWRFLLVCLAASLLAAGCGLQAVTVRPDVFTGTLPDKAVTETDETTTEQAATSGSTSPAETTATTGETTGAPSTTVETTRPTTTRATTRKTSSPTTTASSPYYLFADKASYTLVAYGKDDAGHYTRVVRVMRMAIGRGSMTPTGKFKLGNRFSWYWFNIADEYAQYAVCYSNDLKIHSPLYTERDNTTMIDATYTQIGTKATAGCLRLATGDAYWIFKNCPYGTTLEIVSSASLGFSAPALPPIAVSGQDPTDPNLTPPVTPTVSETTAETTAETTPEETSGTSETSDTTSPTPTVTDPSETATADSSSSG